MGGRLAVEGPLSKAGAAGRNLAKRLWFRFDPGGKRSRKSAMFAVFRGAGAADRPPTGLIRSVAQWHGS